MPQDADLSNVVSIGARRAVPETDLEATAYLRAMKGAVYHRARKRRPTEHTEYAELQETGIDAAGIIACGISDKTIPMPKA
jgi:hypothetical protein